MLKAPDAAWSDALPGADEVVVGGAHAVEAGGGVDEVGGRCGVGLAGVQGELAGFETFLDAELRGGVGGALRPVGGVAAPAVVDAPNLAVAEAEAGRPDDHDQGGVVAGAAVASVTDPRADLQWVALRVALVAPASGQVEDLAGGVRDGQRGRKAINPVGLIARVDQGAVGYEDAAVQVPRQAQHEPVVLVGEADVGAGPVGGESVSAKPGDQAVPSAWLPRRVDAGACRPSLRVTERRRGSRGRCGCVTAAGSG